MNTQAAVLSRKVLIKALVIDLAALTFILLTPSLVHLFNLPVYMLEPMRLMVILSLAHSTKKNTYLLALTLPVFSFIVSGHPEALKMLIITAELVLNVFLFYLLASKIRNFFLSGVLSIVLSKVFCYLAYLVVFSFAFVQEEAAVLFIVVQVLTTLLFSVYLFVIMRNKRP